MAITTQFLTGFEHGFVGAAATAGTGLFNTVSAGITASTSSPRNGSYCAHIVAPTNTLCKIEKTGTSAPKYVARFAVKVTSRPSSGNALIAGVVKGVSDILLIFVSSTGVVTLQNGGNTQTGATIDTTNWHVIEFQVDSAAVPTGMANWKIDGATQPQVPGTIAGNDLTGMYFGTNTTPNPGFTADYDDWIFGTWTDAANDWYGDGKVLAQRAGVDGTHATITSLSPGDAGTAYAGTPTNVNTMVDDPPATLGWTATRSTTDNIALRTATVGAYAAIGPATTAETGQANAVRAIMSYSSSATQANLAACDVRNSAGAVTALWGLTGGVGQDYSETANQFKGAIVTRPAAGWTAAEVNAIRFRFGGCTSADISPVPTVQAMMLEVDWPIAAVPATYTDSASGTITAGGSGVESYVYTDSRTGIITVSGLGSVAVPADTSFFADFFDRTVDESPVGAPWVALLPGIGKQDLEQDDAVDPVRGHLGALTGAGYQVYDQTLPADQQMSLRFAAMVANRTIKLFARMNGIDTTGLTGYSLEFDIDLSESQLYRYDSSTTKVAIGAVHTQNFLNEAVIKLRCEGDQIIVLWKQGGATNWSELFRRTDATYAAPGYCGFGCDGADVYLDDFVAQAIDPVDADGTLPSEVMSREPVAYWRSLKFSPCLIDTPLYDWTGWGFYLTAWNDDSDGSGHPQSHASLVPSITDNTAIKFVPDSNFWTPDLFEALDVANYTTAGVTLMAWVEPDDLSDIATNYKDLVRNAQSYGLYIADGGAYQAHAIVDIPAGGTAEINCYGTTLAAVGEAHFVAMTYSETTKTMKLYIDGVEEDSDTNSYVPGTLMSDAGTFVFTQYGEAANGFNGVLDEVALYARPLSAADILAIYEAGAASVLAPIATFVSQSVTKISRVATKDSIDVVFSVNVDYDAYQVRVVPAVDSIVSAGGLVESGSGGSAGVNRTITLTDDEIVAAFASEGSNIIKIFAQNTAGVWST